MGSQKSSFCLINMPGQGCLCGRPRSSGQSHASPPRRSAAPAYCPSACVCAHACGSAHSVRAPMQAPVSAPVLGVHACKACVRVRRVCMHAHCLDMCVDICPPWQLVHAILTMGRGLTLDTCLHTCQHTCLHTFVYNAQTCI